MIVELFFILANWFVEVYQLAAEGWGWEVVLYGFFVEFV
jgi:hypothetical protein